MVNEVGRIAGIMHVLDNMSKPSLKEPHVKLGDFGMSKVLTPADRPHTIGGTLSSLIEFTVCSFLPQAESNTIVTKTKRAPSDFPERLT